MRKLRKRSGCWRRTSRNGGDCIGYGGDCIGYVLANLVEMRHMSAVDVKPNAMEMDQLLKAVGEEQSIGREKGDPTERRLRVTLEDRGLWNQFRELTNEMIVTKSGR